MEQPDISTVRDETDTAASEAILSELFGPLADRVRGTGPKAAYVNLLLSSVFLRQRHSHRGLICVRTSVKHSMHRALLWSCFG